VALDLLVLKRAFTITTEQNGSVVINHKSGSSIRLESNGDIRLKASGSLFLDAERYIIQGEGEEATLDTINLSRIEAKDPQAIKEIIEEKRLPHLYERALNIHQRSKVNALV
jgi:hypothetical protein